MKGLLVLLAVVGAVVAIPRANPESRIVGGAPAIPYSTPFMISLQWVMRADTRQHFCGGALVAQKWVLTAANCVDDLPVAGRLEAVAGLYRLSDYQYAQTRPVAAVIIHDNFDDDDEDGDDNDVGPYDLAMLFVEEEFYYDEYVRAIPLPPPNSIPEYYATILGWGDTAISGPPVFPDELYSTTTPLVSFETCDAAIGQGRTPFTNTNLCTGPLIAGGVGFCTGDSGGPLVQQDATGTYNLIGVCSWGFSPCGSINAPAVYTRVSAYNAWIYNVMT